MLDLMEAIRRKIKQTSLYIDNSVVLWKVGNLMPTIISVGADCLGFWKVNLPINDELKNVNLDLLESLSPTLDLVTVFPDVPDQNLLHIIARELLPRLSPFRYIEHSLVFS